MCAQESENSAWNLSRRLKAFFPARFIATLKRCAVSQTDRIAESGIALHAVDWRI
jgi:hypothetical protein